MIDAALEHARLQELIAAFVDGELPAEKVRAIREHVRTCARCRNELALQRKVSWALALEPRARASAALRGRIEQIGAPSSPRQVSSWSRRWAAPAAAALVLIGVAGGTVLLRGSRSAAVASIPIFQDAAADCRRAMARHFPRKADLQAAGEGIAFPVRALDQPGLELFSTWKTTLAGAPAVGLAYRWRGRILVQYEVPAAVIERHSRIAEEVRKTGYYATFERGQVILASIAGETGSLLVGNAPPDQLRGLIR
jgi:hypothetical protein